MILLNRKVDNFPRITRNANPALNTHASRGRFFGQKTRRRGSLTVFLDDALYFIVYEY